MFDFFNFQIVKDADEELQELMRQEAVLVDVRTREEVSYAGVEKAINIPMEEIPARLEELDESQRMIVFCRSGNRSEQVKKYLLQRGYEQVLNGGSWQHIEELLNKNKS